MGTRSTFTSTKIWAVSTLLLLTLANAGRPTAQAPSPRRVRLQWDWTTESSPRAGGPKRRVPMIRDFSDRQVISPEVVPSELASKINGSTRFWQQYLRRHVRHLGPDAQGVLPNQTAELSAARDWSFSLSSGSGRMISQPATYVFDVNSPTSCTNDFIVTGVNVAGAAAQANLIGLNSLYNTPAGNGLCAGTAPKVLFAYNIGPGVINSYLALSLDGTKVAFNENNNASSFFDILKWASGAGNGTTAAAAVKPGTGNSAVDVKLALTGGTSTAPFIDYDADVAYVTTSDNVVHKFTGVFLGTPKEVTTAGSGWPVSSGLGGGISTPVFDGISRHVFFTDSANGGIDYVDDSWCRRLR